MSTAPEKVNRRRFLRRAALTSVGGAATAGYYAWRVEPHWVDVERRSMPLAGLPTELVGRRLVHITDLHVSEFVSYYHLKKAIDQVDALDPEIVAITGDLMTARHLEQIDRVTELVARLKPDQRKILVIPGNHDYGPGVSKLIMVETLFDRLQNIGVECLRNELTEYRGLQILGFDEYWARRFRLRPALENFDVSRDGLALTHNPDTVDEPGWDLFHGWILAGHTHGGQCRLPYFGAPILPIRNRDYQAGEVSISPSTTLYVNRGLGYTHRVRFMCSPEITEFMLSRSDHGMA